MAPGFLPVPWLPVGHWVPWAHLAPGGTPGTRRWHQDPSGPVRILSGARWNEKFRLVSWDPYGSLMDAVGTGSAIRDRAGPMGPWSRIQNRETVLQATGEFLGFPQDLQTNHFLEGFGSFCGSWETGQRFQTESKRRNFCESERADWTGAARCLSVLPDVPASERAGRTASMMMRAVFIFI